MTVRLKCFKCKKEYILKIEITRYIKCPECGSKEGILI